MNRFSKKTLMLVAAITLFAASVQAHHADSMYDKSKSIEISGVVQKWQFMAPHSWLYIATTTPEGKSQVWGFEGGAPSVIMGAFVRKDSFTVGEKVTVMTHPLRDGRPAGSLLGVKFEDGRVIKMMGGAPPPGAGDPPPATSDAAHQ